MNDYLFTGSIITRSPLAVSPPGHLGPAKRLLLPRMTVSTAAGPLETVFVPGSTIRGRYRHACADVCLAREKPVSFVRYLALNRELNRARIGHLDRRVERRAVRTGTNTVVVHPGNTSITCSKCGHKDRESRKGPVFECTKCGYQTDADWNAAINIKGRGHNIFSAWKATRERGRAGRSFRREAGEEAGPGQREKAARGAPLQASPNACHLPQNTTGDAKAPP